MNWNGCVFSQLVPGMFGQCDFELGHIYSSLDTLLSSSILEFLDPQVPNTHSKLRLRTHVAL